MDLKIFEGTKEEIEVLINDFQKDGKKALKACPIVPLVVPKENGEGTELKHFGYGWVKESMISQAKKVVEGTEKAVETEKKEAPVIAPEDGSEFTISFSDWSSKFSDNFYHSKDGRLQVISVKKDLDSSVVKNWYFKETTDNVTKWGEVLKMDLGEMSATIKMQKKK